MFFTGLFSTHIPYIILAAIYSVSFGIYSVYYVKNKLLSKEQPEKEIRISEDTLKTGKNFHFKDYSGDESNDFYSSEILTEHELNYGSGISSYVITPHFIYTVPAKEYSLFSRPPPLS